MGNTAIYARVSTHMQKTDRQTSELIAYAKNNHYTVREEHIYIDIISGFTKADNRPCYQQLKEEIIKGNIERVLFSELTRLGRNSNELLSEIEELRKMNVELYFQKQNLLVTNDSKKRNDYLGSELLLHVLAVVATYEIELFSQRGISGKIEKINMGGGDTDSRTFGYMNNDSKMIVIHPEEAKYVQQIFEWYAEGKTTIDICDILNSKNIPTKSKSLAEWFSKNRKKRNLPEKDYSNFKSVSWRPSTISRMLGNRLYIGNRHIELHEPDPTNKTPRRLRTDRKVAYTFDKQIDELRIISDELWAKVQDRLSKAHYNKNNAIKHENFIKHKLVCGECGSFFSVGKSNESSKNYESGGRTYVCYGRIKRIDKPRTCDNGIQVRQWKLDGLVLELTLQFLAIINIKQTQNERREQIQEKIDSLSSIITNKEIEQVQLDTKYKEEIKRLIKNKKGIPEDILEELINECNNDYNKNKQNIVSLLSKYEKELYQQNKLLSQIDELSKSYSSIADNMYELRRKKEILRMLVDDFIEKIELYAINKIWTLVIVKCIDGYEFWGTLKRARYKNEEMFYDKQTCSHGVEFQSWLINNTNKFLSYDKSNHKFTFERWHESTYMTDVDYELEEGVYDFETLNSIILSKGLIGTFSHFDYENAESEYSYLNGISDDFVKEQELQNQTVEWKVKRISLLKRLVNRYERVDATQMHKVKLLDSLFIKKEN